MKKQLIFLICMIMAACMTAACANGQESYENGLKAFQEQKYEEAETYLRRALSQGNDAPAVKADLALTQLKLERYDESLETLNEAYQAAPQDTEVLKRVGLFYEWTSDPQTAASFYESALRLSGGKWTADSLETQGLLAVLYQKNGLYTRAVKGFNTLITQGYRVSDHVLLAGECYLSMQQIYASTQYFDLLDQCQDATADHYLKACQGLKEKRAENEARKYLQKGIELIGQGKGSCSAGEFCCFAGFYDEAEAYAAGKDGHDANMTRALLAFSKNDLKTCETAVAAALSADPDDMDAYALYALVKAKEGDEKTVKQLLTKINAKGSSTAQADALWNQIVMYEQNGKYSDAYSLLKDYRKRFNLTNAVRRELKFLSRLED